MWEDIVRFRRAILILLLLCAGAAFLLLDYKVDQMEKGRKLTSDANVVAAALKGYKTRNGEALPSSFSQLTFADVNIVAYRHGYFGGRGDDSVTPIGREDKKIDLEFFTLYPPGTRIGKSEKEVFAIGKRKGVDLLHVIYVDGTVGFEMER